LKKERSSISEISHMRVLLDANIFISHLLNPKKPGALRNILQAAVRGDYTLLLPEALLDEFVSKIPKKLFLYERITPEELSAFVTILSQVGEAIEEIREEIPAVTRDPKDDYLLAYAVVGAADYLVTGDKVLLVLQSVGGVKIITPVDFASLIEDL
jgi:putative PIN family toxin of toxin-antitoxin system